MANAVPPIIPLQLGISTANVKVTSVSPAGNIHLERATSARQFTPIPPSIKLPLPNYEAFALAHETLVQKTFTWLLTHGGIVEYNIFLDAAGRYVTFPLYMKIVDKIKNDVIGLPEVREKKWCRISPISDATPLYVQPDPVYVDAVSYAIYHAIGDKKVKKMINPAEDLFIGKIYIYADKLINYRVKLVREIARPKPTYWTNMSSLVSTETETTASTSRNPVREYEKERVGVPSVSGSGDGRGKDGSEESGEKSAKKSEGDHWDRILGEKVKALRIDYGGAVIDVPRVHLYTVASVCPALEHIPPLAFPVNVRYINGFDTEKNARIETLRSRKAKIWIETIVRGTSEISSTVDIFH